MGDGKEEKGDRFRGGRAGKAGRQGGTVGRSINRSLGRSVGQLLVRRALDVSGCRGRYGRSNGRSTIKVSGGGSVSRAVGKPVGRLVGRSFGRSVAGKVDRTDNRTHDRSVARTGTRTDADSLGRSIGIYVGLATDRPQCVSVGVNQLSDVASRLPSPQARRRSFNEVTISFLVDRQES